MRLAEKTLGDLQRKGLVMKMTGGRADRFYAPADVHDLGEFLRQLRARELWPLAYVGLAPLDDSHARRLLDRPVPGPRETLSHPRDHPVTHAPNARWRARTASSAGSRPI